MSATFAWCFDHGRLHRVSPSSGVFACTARWARLDGTLESTALADKQKRFGDAVFLADLPLEQQAEIVA